MTGCEYCDNFSMIDGGDEFKAFPGLKGEDGTTFYPHVSAEGILSWTNDGGKPNPDPVNIKGTDGKSAYQAAVESGFTGTEAEFNEYLSGIGDLTEDVAQQKSIIDEKQDAPSAAGLAGQVLGLDEDLNPVWLDQTGGGGSGGTTNYNNLTNKPRINGVLLSGDKSAADLGLATASDIPTVPVQSVNGKTGAVELDASDVGALPDSTAIPSKTSDLTNDSGFVNASGAAAAAPVQSVNGDTGDVTISVPSAASSGTPAMDGTASIGSSSEYARADHVHPTDTSRASAAELATYVRPNLLDNWYFVGGGSQLGYGTFPINQRGQTTYSGIGFCIDRWGRTGQDVSGVELLADGIKITKSGAGSWLFRQEVNTATLAGKTVTFSALAKNVTQDFAINLNIGVGTQYQSHYSSGLGVDQSGVVSVTVNIPSNATSARVILAMNGEDNSSATVVAAKLEIGSTQTLAHQENGAWVLNEVPDYAEELGKCQKYLYPLTAWHSMFCGRVEPDKYRFFIPHQMARTPQAMTLNIRYMLPTQSIDDSSEYTFVAEYGGIYALSPYSGSLPAITMCIAMLAADAFLSCETT